MGQWSEESVTRLKALAEHGYSASQAAAHFAGMTRNGAVGLAHRHNFRFHGGHGGGAHRRPRPRPSFAVSIDKSNVIQIEKPKVKQKYTFLKCDTPPAPNPVGTLTLDDLQDRHCRWIELDPRDPAHRWCGEIKFEHYPYCAAHCMRAFEPRT